MSLPKYEEYRESGLAWIGAVPAHWRGPISLGSISSMKGRLGWQGLKADEYRDEGPYVVSSAHFSEFKIRWDECPRVSDERYETDSNIQLEDGDVLLMKDGAAMGKLAFVADLPGKSCLNSHLLLFRPLRSDETTPTYEPKFLFYYMQTGLFQEHIKVNGTGATFLGISQAAISKYRVVLPSLDEQAAVVFFLDRETTKIDALIAEQEKLIALLAEKRQATISHAVTKGLNPNAPMKNSGVAWLGDVPTHWAVSALSYLASIETGSTPDRAEPRYWNGSIPWLKTGEINWAPIREAEEFITEAGLANSAAKTARPGTLLMAMYGQGVTRGRVALLEIEATYNQACAAIRFGRRLVPEFGRYFFMAAYDHVRDAGNETSQMNLSAGLIAKIRLPVPPVDEQVEVVRLLDSETAKLDVLQAEAERAIALLKERRSALIAAAVTGQIDVRAIVNA
ncbi:restriction endonuclease subunit S [Paucibacter sediminis]|uniref:Restriction endonuclease subunit S n=1 Tax=Paucibacter sediminis TaxID=3019553 RepID=A0AA95NJV9_9BURK|nr:restriction endonuclease subunit S [Paucibacter sp. S2-9]WIT12256.1 restriction endonuclease subunit S [Paucibacter sp. S2-9]